MRSSTQAPCPSFMACLLCAQLPLEVHRGHTLLSPLGPLHSISRTGTPPWKYCSTRAAANPHSVLVLSCIVTLECGGDPDSRIFATSCYPKSDSPATVWCFEWLGAQAAISGLSSLGTEHTVRSGICRRPCILITILVRMDTNQRTSGCVDRIKIVTWTVRKNEVTGTFLLH